MKLWKTLIRIWLTLASLVSFLVGWVVLAHAPKPNQFTPSNLPAAPRLDPVPSLSDFTTSNRSQVVVRSRQQSMPVLRSGGS
jgi:hypothetical protein